jgi:hypothetical protein
MLDLGITKLSEIEKRDREHYVYCVGCKRLYINDLNEILCPKCEALLYWVSVYDVFLGILQ